MSHPQPGRFFAVGVGPGDPQLLTLRAAAILRDVRIVYHPGPAPDRGRALDTVRSILRPEQQCRIVLRDPMAVVSAGDWRRHYRQAVDEIAADCRAGNDVAFITEGDPTLYSTAAHVWQLLAELHPDVPIEVVPGVSSVTAAAARVQRPLAQKDEPLLIVPGSYHVGSIREWLDQFPTICLLKPARVMSDLVSMLANVDAVYVEDVGTPREWISPDLASAAGRGHYFSLVLLRRNPAKGGPSRTEAGCVHVVGIGPGDPKLLTGQARDVLRRADIVIGYEGYLPYLKDLNLPARMIGFPIGAETERARQALDLASAGRRVVLVSSGDAGVYGMASLLLETAESMPEVAIEIVPGVTAATAASALLGAPLGHDFACISLSDLLTPWEIIERRLDAAAAADLVVALYNPVSRRRNWQLGRTREIFLRHRRPDTPVGLVDKAHRPGQRIWQKTLGELTNDGIGMETMVIVGNLQTKVIHRRLVTTRGYPSGGRQPPEYPSGGRQPPEHPSAGHQPPQRHSLAIIDESFRIIERELGDVPLPPWAFAVARRMIHASADFDFARTLRWSANFETAFRHALARHAPIVTDTEMVRIGVRAALESFPDVQLTCYLNDVETAALAESANLTRSAAGIRIAAMHHPSPLIVIGNAPTALEETLRLVAEENWRPAAIVGMPVGFVGVEEAKTRLQKQTAVPYLTCAGRKGGSAVAAAAVNALVQWGSDQ
jgi:precorrin-2 C(20)-methyltransferase